jgi:hypothetical protein
MQSPPGSSGAQYVRFGSPHRDALPYGCSEVRLGVSPARRSRGCPPPPGRYSEFQVSDVPKTSDQRELLKDIHRQLREALEDCHHLLERTEQLIRRMQEEKHRNPRNDSC